MAGSWALNDEWKRRLETLWRWKGGFTVRGAAEFKNTDAGVSFSIPSCPPPPRPVREPLFVKVTGGGGTNGLTWVEASAPIGTNAAEVKPGGMTSNQVSGAGTNGVAWEINGQFADSDADPFYSFLIFRPDSNGALVPLVAAPGTGSTGSSLIPVLCTGTVSAGLYIGQTTFPYTNVASVTGGNSLSVALTPKPELNSETCYLGNWNEFNYSGSNTGTGESLRVGSMYMASYFSTTNDTNRGALYMTQGADGVICS